MFLCQPLIEVLAGRGIEDIDAFLKVPSWNDLPDPFFDSVDGKSHGSCPLRCSARRTHHDPWGLRL